MTLSLHTSGASAQLENEEKQFIREGFEDDDWGRNWEALMGNGVPLANNPFIWELKMEV